MKKLERSLSLTAVIAIGLGGMLGTGIFVLPGLAATKIGASLWLAYLVAAICILPAAYSKSELATAMPSSGGAYVFIERAFGPLFGTISGLGLWIALVLKCAFALVGIGAYVLVVLDMDSEAITKSVGLGFLFLVLCCFGCSFSASGSLCLRYPIDGPNDSLFCQIKRRSG